MKSTSIGRWRAQHFTAAQLADASFSGDLADPFHKGRVNLVEYALGNAPGAPGTAPGMSILGGRLALTFTRNTAATDVTLTMQGTDSLEGTWIDLARCANGGTTAPLVTGVPVSETETGMIRSAEVRDLYLMNDPLHPHRFLRIVVQH